MRKADKKQIRIILELLERVHNTIEKQIQCAEIQPVLELLADCQEAVTAIGYRIEQSNLYSAVLNKESLKDTRQSDSRIISMLEAYAEAVYRMFEQMVSLSEQEQKPACTKNKTANDKIDNEKCLKSLNDLRTLLTEISDEFKFHLEQRKTVVFLPYKASMWDSLESVWKAADEDPDCDAYVIPIPYFDRTADGSFGELHDESALYPAYVPILSYQETDLEELRPDKIFIHNPYDEYNRVTSVHPDFYSSKLKNYTDDLVYIPYFILGEVEPEDETAVEGMEHFCKTPAVLNAHKVIVQSEKMKQVYVKVLTKWQGEHTRAVWEEKILGLGSPKVDKVLNTRKEDLEIPEGWLRIIEKPDGSWKKIVFYNTSLSAFLQYSDTYLDKVEDVLCIFKAYKDEIALLWRPHPLMMSTMESMKPECKERYLEIVRVYKAQGWGIFDESVELDRAIVLSNAYYGDASSVVEVCKRVKMPTFIQNIQALKENNYSYAMDNLVEYKNEWYFYSFKANALFKMDKEKKTVELVVRFLNEKNLACPLYGKIYRYGNKIYLLPWHENAIAIYDLETMEKRDVSIPQDIHSQGMKFFNGIVYGEKLPRRA